MEPQSRTLPQNALIFGLITGLLTIAFSVLAYVMDLPYKSPVMYLTFVILIAGMIYGNLTYRNKFAGGYLSFGKAFLSAFLILMVSAILTTLYSYIFMYYIDPGYFSKIVEQSMEEASDKMSAKGLSQEQIDASLSMMTKMMKPGNMILISLISNVVVGSILSLIAAFATKKEDKTFNAQV